MCAAHRVICRFSGHLALCEARPEVGDEKGDPARHRHLPHHHPLGRTDEWGLRVLPACGDDRPGPRRHTGTQPLLLHSDDPASSRRGVFRILQFFGEVRGILGPTMVGMVALYTEGSHAGIASVVIFFVLGAALLMMVDAEKAAKEVRSTLS